LQRASQLKKSGSVANKRLAPTKVRQRAVEVEIAVGRRHRVADLLGVSRPTVVRLINGNVLPAERIGNRHRLLLDDVLAYRDERRKRQYDALAATAIDIDSDDDPETIRKQLREARRVVAARRRNAAQPG
jgi:excisionase family DNA binding protein